MTGILAGAIGGRTHSTPLSFEGIQKIGVIEIVHLASDSRASSDSVMSVTLARSSLKCLIKSTFHLHPSC